MHYQEMGAYFDKLDTLEFDMGKFEDEEESKVQSKKKDESWTDWWKYKQI